MSVFEVTIIHKYFIYLVVLAILFAGTYFLVPTEETNGTFVVPEVTTPVELTTDGLAPDVIVLPNATE